MEKLKIIVINNCLFRIIDKKVEYKIRNDEKKHKMV